MPEYTQSEMMTVAAARALTSDDVCFVGIGAPSAASNLARLTHAPDICLIYESGTIGTRPDVLPLSIGDGILATTALTTVPVTEMFQYWLQGGRISVGFLGAAQIDRYANINTTVIGDYDSPKVRLPGGGGAPEIAAHCETTFIIVPHEARVFVEQLDFVTSFGHGRGAGDRQQLGLRTAGPSLVITDLCLMRPDPTTAELTVVSIHEGVSRDEIVAATGWRVRFASEVTTTPSPTEDELSVLRSLEHRTELAHQ